MVATPAGMKVLERALKSGLKRAGKGLSQMVNRSVEIATPQVDLVPVSQVCYESKIGPEVALAVYLSIAGDIGGHIILLFDLESARRMVDLLMDYPSGTTMELNDMERSALGETGNLTGSMVLNSLADASGLQIIPSAPTLVVDMADAILNSVLAAISLSDDLALVVKTSFTGPSHEAEVKFYLLPEISSLEKLIRALGGES